MSFADNLNLYQKADSKTLQQIIENAGLEKVLEKNNAQLTTELTEEFDQNGIMLSGGEDTETRNRKADERGIRPVVSARVGWQKWGRMKNLWICMARIMKCLLSRRKIMCNKALQ